MNGNGRDWAIGLGGILALSLALFLLFNLLPGRQVMSNLLSQVEQWRSKAGAREEEHRAPEADTARKEPVYMPLPGPPISPPLRPAPPGAPFPKTDPRSWISSDDYPPDALRNNWQGSVQIAWTIDEVGEVRDCKVMESSGYAVLDEAACNLIIRRAHYWPALDKSGRPVASQSRRRVIWRLAD